VLNVKTWEWYIPKVSGTPPSVVTDSHRAVLVNNKYMIITFGKYYNLYIFVLKYYLFEV
jgi:hypothetical protein